MKTGKTITQLAQQLEQIKETARDFVVAPSKLQAEVVEGTVKLNFTSKSGEQSFGLNRLSNQQVSSYLKIPSDYYQRLASENPSLLATNINHGFNQAAKSDKETSRMVRTVEHDGKQIVRGFLSGKYRRLDSYELVEHVFPTFTRHGLEVVSSEITENRMYIKALSPRLKTEIVKGDTVQYGIVISNSDVGSGSLRIEPLIYRLVCANGMISNTAMKKYHVGRSQSENDFIELLSQDTRNLNDKAFWRTVEDLVESSLQRDRFEKEADRLRVAAGQKIVSLDPEAVVELSMKMTGIGGEDKKKSIIAALATGNEGAGYTKWGLINAYTRAAQGDELDYENATEMERAGGKILELSEKEWKRIAEAVAV